MKRLLNTIYINQENLYLSLDGDNVVLLKEGETIGRVPLHNIEAIITFGYTGASPALMQRCAVSDISLVFMMPNGEFLARIIGKSKGNVLLRKKQYKISDDEMESAYIAKNFIVGKLYNQKWILERAVRDYGIRVDSERIKRVSSSLSKTMLELKECDDLDYIRGLEGQAAVMYNKVFDQLILQQKEDFTFVNRSRRPPMDRVNALLSFSYALLTNEMAAALEAVGLDAYVGFLHRDRPGRVSLALDAMEELRAIYVDRFVLSLINLKVIVKEDFIVKENGAVLLKDESRKKVLDTWQKRKLEQIVHPYLGEKIAWGLVPHVQAMLLARYLRGDLDQYPPFMWK